jgi:hypothetical protein
MARNPEEFRQLCVCFWTALIERAKSKTKLHVGVNPCNQEHLGFRAGTGSRFFYTFGRTSPYVSLFILGKRGMDNKVMYDRLLVAKNEIESRFGQPLKWERLNNRQSARVRFDLDEGSLEDEPHWAAMQDKLIETMIRFERAIRPYLDALE